MNCKASLRSPLSASYGSRLAIPPFSVPSGFYDIAGLALGISGLANRSRRASRFAIVLGIGLASVILSLSISGQGLPFPFRLSIPIQFSKGLAILSPYGSGIHPAHASKACILSGLLRSSIVPALADINNHCPCPDCLPLAGLRLLHIPPNGLFALPFRACLAGVIPFCLIPALPSSIFCEKNKKIFYSNNIRHLGRQRKFRAGVRCRKRPTTSDTW